LKDFKPVFEKVADNFQNHTFGMLNTMEEKENHIEFKQEILERGIE
jgi:hypothetical protein